MNKPKSKKFYDRISLTDWFKENKKIDVSSYLEEEYMNSNGHCNGVLLTIYIEQEPSENDDDEYEDEDDEEEDKHAAVKLAMSEVFKDESTIYVQYWW